MLRLGTARIGQITKPVGQRRGEVCFIDVAETLGLVGARSLDDVLDLPDDDHAEAIAELRKAEAKLDANKVDLLAPLLRPARIRDCGMIKTHLEPAFEQMITRMSEVDSDDSRAAQELLRTRLSSTGARGPLSWGERDADTLSGTKARIVNPGGELDFELELAVILRRSKSGAPQIFGYTLYNDWTLRDVQVANFIATRNLHGPAKNFPRANSFGPMVVLAEDMPDPSREHLSVEVNGELFAEGTLEDAVWTFEDAIPELFRDGPMQGHEIAASGTIFGGSMFERARRLPGGATVRLISPSIGILENQTVAA